MTQMTDKCTDYLKIDPPLITKCDKPEMKQSWAVVSFISPEEIIQQRFFFEANKFLYNDINKQIMSTTSNIVKNINATLIKSIENKINSYKSSENPVYQAAANLLEEINSELLLDEDDQINKVIRTYKIDQQELTDRFLVYKNQNSQELEADFNKKIKDLTSVRGLKIRGVFEELSEAQNRAKFVRDKLESGIHAFVVPVGYWCPWDPSADSIQDQDYMIPQLNDLMGKYQRNVEQRNEFFQKRQQMMMDDAQETKEQNLKEKIKQKLAEKKKQRLGQI